MTDINAVVFSKDRACQLDALLQSVSNLAEWLWPPTVLYASSTAEFERAYQTAAENWGLDLVWQLPLKQKVLDAVDPGNALTAFLVDDDLFYRDFPRAAPAPGRTFSPRLGDNCVYCYNVDKPMRKGEMDFAYWFSIDCHIYRTEDIRPLIEKANFATPNQFEDALVQLRPNDIDYASHSSLVGIPHNKVGEYNNRHAGGSNAELNERYLRGERIDVAAMDFSNIIGVHQEVPYVWSKV